MSAGNKTLNTRKRKQHENKETDARVPSSQQPNNRYQTATAKEMQRWESRLWITDKRNFSSLPRLEPADIYRCHAMLLRLDHVWVSIYPVDSYMHAWNAPTLTTTAKINSIPKFNSSMLLPQLMEIVRDRKEKDFLRVVTLEQQTRWSYVLPHPLSQCPAGGQMVTDQGVQWVECPCANHQSLLKRKKFEVTAGDTWTLPIDTKAIETDPSTLIQGGDKYTDADVLVNGPVWDLGLGNVVGQMMITFENVRSSHQMHMLATRPTYRKQLMDWLIDSSALQGVVDVARLTLSYLENPHVKRSHPG